MFLRGEGISVEQRAAQEALHLSLYLHLHLHLHLLLLLHGEAVCDERLQFLPWLTHPEHLPLHHFTAEVSAEI